MNDLFSFPKIWHIGSPEAADLFKGPVEITEKIDGSQFVFGKRGGELKFRSKGALIERGAPPKMFKPACDYVETIEHLIPDNSTFWGETLATPKHNILNYSRIPRNYIVLFGSQVDNEWLALAKTSLWADKFDLEFVQYFCLNAEIVFNVDIILHMLENNSQLGGEKIEGIVVKNYTQAFVRGNLIFPILCGKYVREDFKERHASDWKGLHTGRGKYDLFLQSLQGNEARWHKAIQHLRENGELTNSPKDIGPLIKLLQTDTDEEDREWCKEQLWDIYKDEIHKNSIRGFAQWYKEQLLTHQGEENA